MKQQQGWSKPRAAISRIMITSPSAAEQCKARYVFQTSVGAAVTPRKLTNFAITAKASGVMPGFSHLEMLGAPKHGMKPVFRHEKEICCVDHRV
jgi:hypothetical protein